MPRNRAKRVRKKSGGFQKLKPTVDENFVKEYKKYNESNARDFYLQTLFDLEGSVATGNINDLKYFSNIVNNINKLEDQTTLKIFHEDARNPLKNTNLVILACKYNQQESLKYICTDDKILINLSSHKEREILPDDEDDTSHNAFYYAIRSGNVELLEILISLSESFFSAHSGAFEEILSKAYEELKLRNVSVTDEMEFAVENKLLNFRFFSDNFPQNQCITNNVDNIKKRIDLIIENTNLLATHLDSDVDEIFLCIIKFIAQNIHTLKKQLKFTYDRLPWEEIEFCLICFVSLHTKEQEINFFYHVALSKSKVLFFLENFSKNLEDVKENVEKVNINKLTCIPNLSRQEVVKNIIRNNPIFEDLYIIYRQIKDIYSLEKIGSYINVISSADHDGEGQLIIIRVLQVIGECLKSTLESPNLSSLTSDLILLKVSKSTRKVITDLRNSLSHAFSLAKRTEIEENLDIKFFAGVKSDLKRVGEIIIDILYNNKIKMIKILLNKIIDSKSVHEITEVARAFKNVKRDNVVSFEFRTLKLMFENTKAFENAKSNEMDWANFRTTEHEKLEKLIKELKSQITDKTDVEEVLFSKIDNIIDSASGKFEQICDEYLLGFNVLKYLENSLNNKKENDENMIKAIQFRAKVVLKNMSSKIESHSLKEIAELSRKIIYSVTSRKIREDLDKIYLIFYEIFYIIAFQTDEIKWIEELRDKLIKKNCVSNKKQNKIHYTKEENNKLLALKLSKLKTILENHLNAEKTEKKYSYKDDKKLQAIIEMLLLDIMSVLSMPNCCLENNQFYLDDNYPLLLGKCLRNHLAHYNTLCDILLSNPFTAIIVNAKKLTEEDIITSKKKIGKIVAEDPLKLQEKFNQNLKIITYQRKMYDALELGNIECLKECIVKGADINARSISSWTALHYAAKGPSLEVIEFILKQNVQINVKDKNGQNPLHIAAAYGNTVIVKYLVEKADFSVNKKDYELKTPLHIAAQNGHKDTVEVLLKFNAESSAKDVGGNLALHYAIRNHHFQIAKIFLKTNVNVDINESSGGFTPLHVAAEFGHMEAVTFLLQNGADVNTKNDRNWTPLHAAALKGHLDVTEVLISEGADVNARVIDGCTPLHYALENCHEAIANILLRHGAKVNIRDKTYKNTALHYAAMFGYENTVKTLLKYEADVTARTFVGKTPLHFAAYNGNLEIISTLMKQDVDINAKDISNATPLHYAAISGQKEGAAFLIKNGATVDVKDDKYFTPLYIAVTNSDRDFVNMLIENKANINERDIKGSTILHASAMNGCKHVTDILIKHKADVNARNNYNLTPLHIASREGHEDVAVLLIENKAEVNTRAFNGLTPLQAAVIGGHKHIVELLIKNKSDINAKTSEGLTSLYLAIEAGHREITEFLIVNGADVNEMTGNNFLTPLLTAVKYNNKEIVQILLDNGAIIDNKGNWALSLAVIAGYRDIVEILIKNKARLDIVDAKNVTLVHLAAEKGHTTILKMLIKKGGDVNDKTIDNETPLYFSARNDHEEVAEILIANGANVNTKCHDGTTALHIAASQGHNSILKVLLDNQADETAKDNKNRTPLELAVENGHLQVTKMLLKYKRIDINAKNDYQWTLLHIAAQGNSLKLIKYLINEGADINSENSFGSKPIHIAAREGFKDAVEYFLRNGCNINVLGDFNRTLLHYAVIKNKLEIVTYLIDKGANVNAKDKNSSTAIHLAASYGYKNIIEVLLKSGATYNIADKFGRKPLKMATKTDVYEYLMSIENFFKAVKRNNFPNVKKYIETGLFVDVKKNDGITPLYFAAWKGHEEVINFLLESNANPNTVNNKGMTPLHYAAKFSHLKVVKALLSHGAIFNAVSHKGTTPSDFSIDKNIINLFKLISDSFESVKNRRSKIICDLNKIKDRDTMKAIMNACNRKTETLIVAAIRCSFPNVDQLKNILQDGVSDAVNRAVMLVGFGDYQNALCIFNEVYKNRKYILGPNNPGTLEIERYIAEVLYKQGNYKTSLHKFQEIYQKQRESLGIDNNETLRTRSLLALVLHRLKKNVEALAIFQEVYQMQEKILGPKNRDTIATQIHMALVLADLKKYDEALNINRRIYKESKLKFGANNPLTISVRNNIAMVLTKQGNYGEALEIYRDVLQKKKIILGIYHADTLRTLQTIATILSNQKKYREAREAYQEVLNIQKVSLGPNNPETLITQNNLADLLLEQGKFANALKVYTECFEKCKAIWGANSSMVLNISRKIQIIKLRFQFEGIEASEILTHMQDDVKLAIINDDVPTILSFLKEKACINKKDNDGITLLHYAVRYEQKNVVKILLKNGADVFQITYEGLSPLHLAVSKNNSEIVQILLQHVQRDELSNFINAKTTFDNNTALYIAAENGSLDIVKILLEHGAIYDHENNEGKKPQNISINQNVTNLLKLIDELFEDAKGGNKEVIKKFKSIEKNDILAVTNARNNERNTLLQVLITKNHIKIANTFSEMLKAELIIKG